MIRLSLSALLVAYLPGALIFRAPIADRARRASLGADERVFWHVILSVAWSLAVVLALAAGEAYRFDRLLLTNIAVCVGLVIVARTRLLYRGAAARPSWTLLLPLVLVGLGVWRFFPSSEYIIGGKDPGTYINEGIQIAQRGSIVLHDPVVIAIPTVGRSLFFPTSLDPNAESSRFMGFYLLHVQTGEVVGQLPHLFPASIAVGYGLDGLTGARMAVGVWAILGLAAVYFTGARLIGRAGAFCAAALLSLHVVQVWFARYPNSEMAMQALVFAALLAFARAHQDADRFFAPVAGGLAAAMIFLRLDALLVVAALVTVAGLTWLIEGIRPRLGFVLTIVLGSAAGWLYLTGPLRAYFGLPVFYLSNLPRGLRLAALASALLALAVLLALRRWSARRLRAAVPVVMAAVLLLAAGYAAFFRLPVGKLADYDALALRTFTAFYLLWPGLLAALIGMVLVFRSSFWRDPAFAIVFAAFSLFFFYKIHVVPLNFWMARRFVSVILPGALLFAAAAALGSGVNRLRGWHLVRPIAGLVFLGWLGSQYAAAAAPVLPHVEYAGIIPYLEQLAAQFSDRDLVLVESRDANSDTHVFAQPLAYIYARHVLVLASAKPDKPQLQAFLEDATKKYDRVLFVGGGGTDLLSRRIIATPIHDGRRRVPEYESSPWNVYPQGVRSKDFDYSVYELTLGQRSGSGFTLAVGDRDDLNVVRFHAKEVTEGRAMRWTGRQSFVSIPGLTGQERRLTMTMNDGGRPREAAPAQVRVLFNNQLLGTLTVGQGFQPYTLDLPADLVARAASLDDPAILTLISTVWNPHAILGRPDDRDLGVMLARVEIH
jgi:hypothetical protein